MTCEAFFAWCKPGYRGPNCAPMFTLLTAVIWIAPATAAQRECIPWAISGRDVICEAKGGMGKTTSYILAVLQQLDLDPALDPRGVLAVVLVPTRELAWAIAREFERHSKYMPGVRRRPLASLRVPLLRHTLLGPRRTPRLCLPPRKHR